MTTLTHPAAAERIERYLDRDAILRGQWHDGPLGPDGYERACLLVAAVPEVGKGKYDACPASLMPPWLAYFTPWIDDAGSTDPERREAKIRRYAGLLRRSAVLTPEAWSRLDYRVRRIAVLEARSHCPASEVAVLAATDAVVSLLDRAISGETIDAETWRAAAAAARAAGAASWAAWAARAAGAASWAAWAARAAGAAAAEAADEAAAVAAEAAASDRIIDAALDAWEGEIRRAGTGGRVGDAPGRPR